MFQKKKTNLFSQKKNRSTLKCEDLQDQFSLKVIHNFYLLSCTCVCSSTDGNDTLVYFNLFDFFFVCRQWLVVGLVAANTENFTLFSVEYWQINKKFLFCRYHHHLNHVNRKKNYIGFQTVYTRQYALDIIDILFDVVVFVLFQFFFLHA